MLQVLWENGLRNELFEAFEDECISICHLHISHLVSIGNTTETNPRNRYRMANISEWIQKLYVWFYGKFRDFKWFYLKKIPLLNAAIHRVRTSQTGVYVCNWKDFMYFGKILLLRTYFVIGAFLKFGLNNIYGTLTKPHHSG